MSRGPKFSSPLFYNILTMIPEGLTFKDVLLTPQRSDIASRKDVDVSGRFSRHISLMCPIVSANMDTVTESAMAVAMARLGGLGIIHRFLSVEDEVAEVERVKRAESFVIDAPYAVSPADSVATAAAMMEERRVGGLLVLDQNDTLLGIITSRDVQFVEDRDVPVKRVMTRKVITGPKGISEKEARKLLRTYKIEKLPLIDKKGRACGLITGKDLLKRERFPDASKDAKGRLLVGAAVGIVGDYLERAQELVDSGADVLVVDVAHGHTSQVINVIKRIKRSRPKAEVVAGNVATFAGARDLASAGADGVKVGVGPGATCSTRVVTGSGVPQLTAVMEAAKISKLKNVPICADGGIRDSGDLTKALAAGASSVMIGSMLAGTDESPGWTMVRGGIKYKVYRGMASLGATMGRREKSRDGRSAEEFSEVVAEGVESTVPYRGAVFEVVHQLIGGLRSGMSYSGARDLKSFQKKASFIRISPAGWTESKPQKGLING